MMTDTELRDAVGAMYASVREGEGDPGRRNGADETFRDRYRACVVAGALPAAVEHELRAALVALAGEDDWPAASAHLAQALHHLPVAR